MQLNSNSPGFAAKFNIINACHHIQPPLTLPPSLPEEIPLENRVRHLKTPIISSTEQINQPKKRNANNLLKPNQHNILLEADNFYFFLNPKKLVGVTCKTKETFLNPQKKDTKMTYTFCLI